MVYYGRFRLMDDSSYFHFWGHGNIFYAMYTSLCTIVLNDEYIVVHQGALMGRALVGDTDPSRAGPFWDPLGPNGRPWGRVGWALEVSHKTHQRLHTDRIPHITQTNI